MSANLKSVQGKSVRERVSKEEWQMRVDLAAAYQLAHIYKWTDLIYTHFSARVPGTHDFLINPYGMMFDEITASSLILPSRSIFTRFDAVISSNIMP